MLSTYHDSLPTLYKKHGVDGLQQWTVTVRAVCECAVNANEKRLLTQEEYDSCSGHSDADNLGAASEINTTYGMVGGKMQTSSELIFEGKNIGRSNQTSISEQAIAEAKSKWELQKKKKGYVETVEAAEAGEVDALVQGGIFPMLAQKFQKQAEKIKYPAFVQPKFDGHRCIAIVKDGACTLWSRTRKPINSVPHINRAVQSLTGGADAIFDGELYNHEYHAHFEQITKLIRPLKPVEGHEKVKFYIYDMPSAPFKYEDRWRMINRIFAIYNRGDELPGDPLVNVETYVVESEAEVPLAFDRFFSQKYEGAMLRTADNIYDGHPTRRSKGLLKLKKFDDAEFEIVDVVEGTGKMAGKAIFVCRAGNGESFDAVKNGPLAELKEYWENRQALIGMQVTVQFQGFTTKKGVPRFPRALRLRDDL